MLRFIFNFIFFGLLFYFISKEFPGAFDTLLSWVDPVYDLLKELVLKAIDWLSNFFSSLKNS